jgi:hypothetical protein
VGPVSTCGTSRVMVADRPYGEFYTFYSVSPEYFGYNLKHSYTHSVYPYVFCVLSTNSKEIQISCSHNDLNKHSSVPGYDAVSIGTHRHL